MLKTLASCARVALVLAAVENLGVSHSRSNSTWRRSPAWELRFSLVATLCSRCGGYAACGHVHRTKASWSIG